MKRKRTRVPDDGSPNPRASAGEQPQTDGCERGRGRGVSRREFFTSVGVGAAAATLSCRAGPQARPEGPPVAGAGELARVELRINGQARPVLVDPRWTLLFVLREQLGLTATKQGCGRGECGACTVLVDDEPRYACMSLAVEAEGRAITTLEGLMDGEALGPVQQAFLEADALQCGYCTPGQIMAVEGLLRADPEPGPEAIRRAVSGNLCRCGAYQHIFTAARRAAEIKRERGGAS